MYVARFAHSSLLNSRWIRWAFWDSAFRCKLVFSVAAALEKAPHRLDGAPGGAALCTVTTQLPFTLIRVRAGLIEVAVLRVGHNSNDLPAAGAFGFDLHRWLIPAA